MGGQTKNDFSRFDAMTTEELKLFLRGYLDAPEIAEDSAEMEAVLYVMEVVERRENEYKSNTEEAWRDFTENYLPRADAPEKNNRKHIQPETHDDPNARKPRGRRRFTVLTRVACAALVILAVGFAGVGVARASGYDLFGAVGTWTDEIFTFRGRSGKLTLDVPCDSPDGAKYFSLQEALDAYDVTLPLAPKWIPKEYSISMVNVVQYDNELAFYAMYTLDEDEDVCISFFALRCNDDNFGIFEKTDDPVLEYWDGGICHYLMTNSKNIQAAWINENFECGIAGTGISFDQLEMIVSSIYDKEGQAHTAYESERGGRLTMDVPSDVPEGEVVYTSLQQALDAYDVNVPLAPTWIPKEYSFNGVSAAKILEEIHFFANYVSSDGEEITASIHIRTNPDFSYVEKDAGDVEIYETGGIDHYIMTNLRYTQASWLNENCECILAGSSLSVKQLKQIIDSIYGRN